MYESPAAFVLTKQHPQRSGDSYYFSLLPEQPPSRWQYPFHYLHVSWRVRSMNGQDLGVAFVGFDMEGLYPAASMNVGQAALFNFGQSPFLYTPTNSVGPSFQPVSGASAERVRPRATGDVEGTADGENIDNGTQNATHEPSLRGIRGRNVATGAGRSDIQSYPSNGEGHTPGGESGENSQQELERQRLVESLIGMGFPIEWAIRAGGRSGE